MEPWLQMVLTILGSVVASSGFWTFMMKRYERKDVRNEMLVGLAHDRIVYLGLMYLERGTIAQEEYENLYDYLYVPYEKMGGNGTAKKIMEDVSKLPIRYSKYSKEA